MRVGIIGAGAWGTALGIVAARGGADVLLWSYDGTAAAFDGTDMPENITVDVSMAGLGSCDAWLIVTPAAFFRETVARAREFYKNQPVIICAKGAESATGDFMSEVLRQALPECTDFGVLSGPQFAAEAARGIPTGSTLAGTPRARAAGRTALNQLYLTETDDVIGTELCGVGKNAVALICGYNSVKTGENERAMMFTRAWGEVVDMGLAMGADVRTFLDLCGIGDLFLSAASATSRNFSAGMAIARGDAPSGTVEGIFALSGLVRRAAELGVATPVLSHMQDVMKI